MRCVSGTRAGCPAIWRQPQTRTRTMPMDAHEIERLIKSGIPDAQVTIRDLAGDGDHYAATVIAASFKGKSRVQQHQLVYSALKGQMGGVLHALALQTGVPQSCTAILAGRLGPGWGGGRGAR